MLPDVLSNMGKCGDLTGAADAIQQLEEQIEAVRWPRSLSSV